jgi:ribosomal protein S18 acetylase RimI-like enzyme
MRIEVSEANAVDDELVAAFARLIPQLSSSNPPPDADALRALVDQPDVFLLLARDADNDGYLVGSLTLVTFRIPTGLRAWIEDVVVDGDTRRSGAGRALTLYALDKAKALGVSTVDLTSRPSREAANAMYVKLGFELRQSNLYRYDVGEK